MFRSPINDDRLWLGLSTGQWVLTLLGASLWLLLFILPLTCGAQGSCASPDGAMVAYTGGNITYATANGNGWCYNNLNADQTYCFYYYFPTSGDIEIDWNMSGCGCVSAYQSASPANGGSCSSTCCSCLQKMYDESCTFLWNGFKTGSGCPQTAGKKYTICFTVPSGCGGMSVCPLIKCSSGECVLTTTPVVLTRYTVVCTKRYRTIQWSIGSQVNALSFMVLKVDYAGSSTKVLTEIVAAGTTSLPMDYSFTDFDTDTGSYYVLYQTDIDGKTVKLGIVSCSEYAEKPLKTTYVDITGKVVEEGILSKKGVFIKIEEFPDTTRYTKIINK